MLPTCLVFAVRRRIPPRKPPTVTTPFLMPKISRSLSLARPGDAGADVDDEISWDIMRARADEEEEGLIQEIEYNTDVEEDSDLESIFGDEELNEKLLAARLQDDVYSTGVGSNIDTGKLAKMDLLMQRSRQ